MSVFREATKYIHGDKLWSWNPANHLKDIEISKISTVTTRRFNLHALLRPLYSAYILSLLPIRVLYHLHSIC